MITRRQSFSLRSRELLNYSVWQMIFVSFFDRMVAKYTFKSAVKRSYHRNSTMSKAEIMLIMILFHDSNRWNIQDIGVLTILSLTC